MKTFSQLNLIEPLLRAVSARNYDTTTPIQAETIPPLLAGRDVLGCAQTGTGKTAAFGLPIINQIKIKYNHTQCIIICPTRELCIQIKKDLDECIKRCDKIILNMDSILEISKDIKKLVIKPSHTIPLDKPRISWFQYLFLSYQ